MKPSHPLFCQTQELGPQSGLLWAQSLKGCQTVIFYILTSMTVSSVGSNCRPPNHHRSRTRGRLDLVRQQRVTFLFSDCETDPRMVMALGGTEDRHTKERWEFRPGSSIQTDGNRG